MKTHLQPGTPLLYLAGEERAGDLAGDLAAAGIEVATAVVYRARRAGGVSAGRPRGAGAGWIDGVLHFSRRSAETYLGCAAAAGLTEQALAPVHYCLSPQVAEPLAAAGARNTRLADQPDEAALIGLIAG